MFTNCFNHSLFSVAYLMNISGSFGEQSLRWNYISDIVLVGKTEPAPVPLRTKVNPIF